MSLSKPPTDGCLCPLWHAASLRPRPPGGGLDVSFSKHLEQREAGQHSGTQRQEGVVHAWQPSRQFIWSKVNKWRSLCGTAPAAQPAPSQGEEVHCGPPGSPVIGRHYAVCDVRRSSRSEPRLRLHQSYSTKLKPY